MIHLPCVILLAVIEVAEKAPSHFAFLILHAQRGLSMTRNHSRPVSPLPPHGIPTEIDTKRIELQNRALHILPRVGYARYSIIIDHNAAIVPQKDKNRVSDVQVSKTSRGGRKLI